MSPTSKKLMGHIGLDLTCPFVRPSARPSVCFSVRYTRIQSRTVRDRIFIKNKRNRIFFSFPSDLSMQSYVPFANLWNIVNKISGEPHELGSWYLAYRLWPRYRWPDKVLAKFFKYLAELSPFSDFGIVYSKATLWTKYLEDRLS